MDDNTTKISMQLSSEDGYKVFVRRGNTEVGGVLSHSFLHGILGMKQKKVYTIAEHKLSFTIEQVESVTMYTTRVVVVLKCN